jgi:FkbM family methyltransferase
MLKDFLVIITISDKSIQNEVKLILSSMGHQNIICCSDVPEFNFVYFPKEFVLSPEKFYTKQIDKILNAFCLFKDKISKEIYIKFIRLYLEKQPQIFPYDNVNFQYFPFDIPIPKSNYHYFLDGGAYNGDTVLKLINSLGKIKNLICFEPSKNNFIRLNTFLHRKKRKIADNILSCPFGLWEKTTRLLFKDAGPDSHIRENIISREDSFVPVVAIDDILIDYPIKFIKMDIEGAELKALIGAEKIIQRLKPTLAICVYHTPNHIWEIPLFLNQLKLNYNFFLRAYSFFGIEIVLYAV